MEYICSAALHTPAQQTNLDGSTLGEPGQSDVPQAGSKPAAGSCAPSCAASCLLESEDTMSCSLQYPDSFKQTLWQQQVCDQPLISV
jgi:hypothetical protein